MIRLKNITKKYNEHFALKNINLNIRANETTAIIGSSGSGKSTLLRCMTQLERQTSGHVYIEEEKLTTKNSDTLCRKIGMVFQNFNLFPHLNVLNNLIYAPAKVLNMNKYLAQEKAEKLLEQFSLKSKLSSFPSSLSGGQKQRVAICRALMMEPKVMLFDEPTSALDPEVIKDIVDAIHLLKKQMTMVIVTHHIKFAREVADNIIFIDHGLILADQQAADFFKKPSSHRARLFLSNIGDMM
ncbi:MAG: amino acid ABC transporter ATP-binding protein [Rickettsiaceae bacterium]|nr:MAG: amino acid ABC transporter ATP-binding protein [Rickettsiaceae bacterium]